MADETRVRECPVCKAPMMEELQDYVVEIDGEELLVEDVPMWACPQCGFTEIEEEVIEAIEDMLDHMDTVASDEEE